MERPLHAVVVTVVVRDAEQGVLMIKHPRRGWELPQGHVEHGEDLFAAVSREVLEESGYEVKAERLLAVFSKIDPLPSSVVFGFAARLIGGEATTSEESLEVGWFDADLAVEMAEHPVNRERIARLLLRREGVGYYSYRMSPFEMFQEVEV
jgi:8-oxo-dGTP diphosphatase